MPDFNLPPGGWREQQNLVLEYLQRHGALLQKLDEKLDTVLQREIPELKVEIATLKVRGGLVASVLGLLGGAVSVLISLLTHVWTANK